MIEVRNLTKSYDGKAAISDLTFDVEEGEVLGLLGPNGAGKTTTMRAITGYLPATAGSIAVDGFDVFDDPIEVRRRIGYLPEQPPLYVEMTVAGYLRFVSRIKGVPRADVEFEIERVMERVNIEDVAERIIGRLSKGYRQRVGLAQALINDPPILILDEPTAGLDPKQIHEVRELIREWKGEHTVILSTHILSEVEQTCSRVVIIDRGRIIAVDTPSNLVHQLKGSDRIVVEVAAPPEAVIERLSTLAGVVAARDLGAANGHNRIEVETGETGDPVQPQLARAIVESGWGLFGMQSSTMSLEDIFLQLTTDDEDAGPEPGGDTGESNDEHTGPEPGGDTGESI